MPAGEAQRADRKRVGTRARLQTETGRNAAPTAGRVAEPPTNRNRTLKAGEKEAHPGGLDGKIGRPLVNAAATNRRLLAGR